MNRPGIKSTVYHGTVFLGEVEVFPTKRQNFQFPNNQIRISHLSPSSLRCPPLAILQAISPFSVPCKILAKPPSHDSLLARLHTSCFHDSKTAAVVIGDQELHLVAMPSKSLKSPTFWCCSIQAGLYASCLGMLNLRCLAIVFDLDETLIVANTMKSFEDRIEALSRRIDNEIDPVRVSGMSVELKRYIEDKDLLKQYTETNTVSDDGRLVSALNEEVPSLPGTHEAVARPVIRLPEKNVVLTRINPEICDTSVFVRLRPAWDDLRSYLIAKGRKRFDVYVCTMAERDYALEMWRLLDPEAHLICSNQLLDRVTCVRSGSRKSLLNVFQDGICHPRMAMVIDDRLQVWDDKDQHRVHVVPAFTPYYAPQAEMATAVPILCVARNVACNVRGGFFKEFDEKLLPRISELCYENDIWDLPYAPDVSDYLTSEDNCILPNNSKDAPISEGITGVEVERKLNRNANLGDGHTQNQSRFPHPYSGSGASSSTGQQGMWSSGLPSWDPQGNMNYQWQFMGNMFDFVQKVAVHAAQQTSQYDAVMARTPELEQERDEWQRRSDDWERKSGEWEARSGEWQRKSCEYEQERDEAVRLRLQVQADLTQSQEALGTTTQANLDLAAKVEKLQLDVVDSWKKVEKAFSLYEQLKNRYKKKKKDNAPSPPKS